jgi:1H-pyrrole-2-carbonyl-[peptidyl-carrier protein] chlorinase
MIDVAIVGGGPAGSALGSYLSQAGLSNVIVEKDFHPRPHVGESLVTSTVRTFKDIGFLATMEREGFVRKYGAAWHPTTKRGEFAIEFAEFPQPGVEQDYVYHVDRARFDLLMLQHAKQLGSKVLQGIAVKEVLFEDERANGIRCDVAGETVDIPARLVVDASGRATILGNQLRLREKDPVFNQFAVYAWFENVQRGRSRTADYIHIYFLPATRGWAWQIPITDEITSVGVVAERAVFKQSRQRVEEYFSEHVATSPDLAMAMSAAKRVTDFSAEADYSYSMKRFAGDGWLLVGDAARFVDPIFSSGVSIALESAKSASETIVRCLEAGDVSRAMLQPYEDRLKAGVSIWYEFIRLYYKLMHLFTYFIQSKEHRHQVLQLLQGEVYDRDAAPVLDEMRSLIRKVEQTPGHVWQSHLTDVPID